MPFRRIIFLLLLFVIYSGVATSQVVVTHAQVKMSSLNQQDLRMLFSMKMTRWPDKSAVVVFTLDNSTVLHKEFCRKVLNIFPYQLQRAWDRLVYSGIGQAPIKVNSIAEMKERLATTPGAIGYLPEEMANDKRIRVIKIISTD